MKNEVLVKKSWLISNKNTDINALYDIDFKNILGSGAFGTVHKAKLKDSHQYRAIKKIPKQMVSNKQDFINQIEILQKLVTSFKQDHPNIIKLYETYEDSKNIYLVTLCTGGELFDKIIDKGQFTEADARDVFLQIIHALNYMHSNGIAHRDLKPQNFLLLTNQEKSPIKIIDFGLSFSFSTQLVKKKTKSNMKTVVGTSYYMAPQIIDCNSTYNQLCDIWSAGVILYILLSGIPPFNGQNDQQIFDMIKKGQYTFQSYISLLVDQFNGISEEAKDVIRRTLVDPAKRPKASQVLKFQWLKQEIDPKKLLPINFKTLKKYTDLNKVFRYDQLKRIALTYIATQIPQTEIMQLSAAFKAMDLDGDGVLTVQELKKGIHEMQLMNENELHKLIESIDTDGSGKIDYTQFIAASMNESIYTSQQKLMFAFKKFDIDGNGRISKNELKQILGRIVFQQDQQLFGKKEQKFWDDLIKEADKNGDDEIDYTQFAAMMKGEGPKPK